MTTAETAGKRKEEKLREEVQCLQQQIESKEQEIQTTQKQIVQALLALAADTEDCVRHSHGLGDLLCRLGQFTQENFVLSWLIVRGGG